MRKARAKKNILLPDPKFGDIRVTRFVNDLMHSGKKSVAFKTFYDALEMVERKPRKAVYRHWMSGKRHSKTLRLRLKLKAAGWVEQPSRFRWKFVPTGRFPLVIRTLLNMHVSVQDAQ
jgi:hypothetical protein